MKAHPEPYFSVIITTWNRAALVTRAIDSVIAQKEKEWEVIIVDDGSTDDTSQRVKPYTADDGRIICIKHAHCGEAMSKNTGIAAAAGKYITFLDSDDEYLPGHLGSRKKLLLENPSVQVLYGGVKILGDLMVPDRFDPSRLVSLNNCVIGGSFFIERKALRSLGGFRNLVLGADADLLDRAFIAGFTTMKVNRRTYLYHHENCDSITNRILAGQDPDQINRPLS